MRKPVRHIGEPASLDKLALLVAAMPERLRLMIELAAWCALRYGEVAKLRPGDIDLKNGVIRVARAVQWVDGTKIVAAPKADSVRVVAFRPHIGEAIKDHLKNHARWGRNGLLFPTTHGHSTERHLPPGALQEGPRGRPTPRPPIPRSAPHGCHIGGSLGRQARGADAETGPHDHLGSPRLPARSAGIGQADRREPLSDRTGALLDPDGTAPSRR